MLPISEVSSKSRECAACGGSGSGCDSRPCDMFCSCPVCLGSGRIVDDSASQRDADADAETLRAGENSGNLWWDLLAAEVGDVVYRAECGMEPFERAHARAAFRAVPELRGE